MGLLIVLLVALIPFALAFYAWWRDPYRRMPKGARKLPGPWSTRHLQTIVKLYAYSDRLTTYWETS